MKLLSSVILLMSMISTPLHAQHNIVVDTSTYSIEELIRDVLVKSDCAEVENITFFGKPAQIGYFTRGTDAIKVEEGIIISTGSVLDAVGPNVHTGTTTYYSDGSHVGDDDLRRVANVSVNQLRDDAIIEFDFIPLEDHIEFEFVFASEEYCDYAGPSSLFNDVFGFFLSGPGISGPYTNNARNIAVSPGGGNNITVLNINHNVNYQYFIDNTPKDQPLSEPIHYQNCRLDIPRDGITSLLERDGESIMYLEYDGYTVTLKAQSDVTPGQRYHLKIGIADVEDETWDSAVFLKAGSFNAGQPRAEIATPVALNCMAPLIQLDATASSTGSVYAYAWSTQDGNIVSGDNTLMPVIDAPGRYQLIVRRNGSTCSDTAQVDVIFDDSQPEIQSAYSDMLTCDVLSVNIVFTMADMDAYSYRVRYPSGTLSAISSSPVISSSHPGWHTLYAYGSNGCEDSIPHLVEIDSFSGSVSFLPYQITCADPQIRIEPTFNHQGRAFSYLWNTSDGNIISDRAVLNISVDMAGTYTLQATSLDNGCSSTHELVVTDDFNHPIVTAGEDVSIPCMAEDVGLNGAIQNPTGTEDITWIARNGSFIQDGIDPLHPIVSSPGIYVLQVTGDNGCLSLDSVEVMEDHSATTIELLEAETITCDDPQAAIDITVDTPLESIEWTTHDGDIEIISANSLSILVNSEGLYTVEVTNAAGCLSTLSVSVSESVPPIADAGTDLTLSCEGTAELRAEEPIAEILEYTWYNIDHSQNTISGQQVIVDLPGIYRLEVYDPATGCSAADQVEVKSILHEVPYSLEFEDCVFESGKFSIAPADQPKVDFITYAEAQYEAGDIVHVGEHETINITLTSGCTQQVDLHYILNEDLTIEWEAPDEIIAGEPFTLSTFVNRLSSEIDFIEWDTDADLSCLDCLDPELSIVEFTTISLTIKDQYGCLVQDQIHLDPKVLVKVYIPNAFSPNDDGINDRLDIRFNEYVAGIKSMKIYNRWGQRVFFLANDDDLISPFDAFSWGGYIGNQPAPEDVYIYEAVVLSVFGQPYRYTGQFVLMR